jgi:hypothetical protein
MAFNVGDIVRKKTKTQKYKVKEVLVDDNYNVQYEPNTAPDVVLEFHGSELELVS